jgi:hypothetical protein
LTPSVESGAKAAADALGINLTTFHASTDEEIEATLRNATGPVAGLVIGTDPLFTSHAKALGTKSLEYKLPARPRPDLPCFCVLTRMYAIADFIGRLLHNMSMLQRVARLPHLWRNGVSLSAIGQTGQLDSFNAVGISIRDRY